MSPRHAGKPLLRMVDAFVLDAIGHLDPAEDAALVALEPELRHTFGTGGGWREIAATTMKFPDGMAAAVREVWEKGRARFFASEGYDPDPEQFTRAFVDSKFPR